MNYLMTHAVWTLDIDDLGQTPWLAVWVCTNSGGCRVRFGLN